MRQTKAQKRLTLIKVKTRYRSVLAKEGGGGPKLKPSAAINVPRLLGCIQTLPLTITPIFKKEARTFHF